MIATCRNFKKKHHVGFLLSGIGPALNAMCQFFTRVLIVVVLLCGAPVSASGSHLGVTYDRTRPDLT